MTVLKKTNEMYSMKLNEGNKQKGNFTVNTFHFAFSSLCLSLVFLYLISRAIVFGHNSGCKYHSTWSMYGQWLSSSYLGAIADGTFCCDANSHTNLSNE